MVTSPDRFRLDGRLALVTGASRGIGAALAKGVAEAGADVVLAARSVDPLYDLADEIAGLGRLVRVMRLDVADTGSIDAMYGRLGADGAVPDLLINNAGTEEVMSSLEVTPELWDRIIDTNLRGAFFVAQGFGRGLVAAGMAGSVVNLCSLSSKVGIPTAVPYTSSKSGMAGMTRALSAEWARHRIRVNGLGPGYFRTEMTEGFYADRGWHDAMLGKLPLGRFGELDDLIGATVFLLSPASAYVTGQVIYVDGGYLASI